MKLEFIKIKVKNFRSYGNKFVEYNFKNGVDLILGPNGQGKTSLFLHAIVYALYDIGLNKESLSELINDINNSDMVVELELLSNSVHYRIVRGRKKNLLEIYKNHSENPLPSINAKEDNKYIIEKILNNLNKSTFFNIFAIQANRSDISIFRMDKAKRRELIETIFDVSLYTKMKQNAKIELDLLVLEKQNILKEIKTLESVSENYKRNILSLSKTKELSIEKIEEKIIDLKSKIYSKEKIKELRIKREEINNLKSEFKYKYSDYISLLNKHNSYIDDLNKKENDLKILNKKPKDYLSKILNNYQELDLEIDYEKKIKKLEKDLEKNDKIISSISTKIVELKSDEKHLNLKSHITNVIKKELSKVKELDYIEIIRKCFPNENFEDFGGLEISKIIIKFSEVLKEKTILKLKIQEDIVRNKKLLKIQNTIKNDLSIFDINIKNLEKDLNIIKIDKKNNFKNIIMKDKELEINEEYLIDKKIPKSFISSIKKILEKNEKNLNIKFLNINKEINENEILIKEINILEKSIKDQNKLKEKKIIEKSLKNNESKILSLKTKLKKIEEDIEKHNEVFLFLKTEKIKHYIIKQSFPLLKEEFNKILLNFFFGEIKIELADDFDISVYKNGKKTSFETFSEGEKKRLDLAFIFTIHHFMSIKNQMNINLLIIDELLDSALDSIGITNVLDYIQKLKKNMNVILVTHKEESMEYDRKFIINKIGKFSKINEVENNDK